MNNGAKEDYNIALIAHRTGDFKTASVLYQRVLQKFPQDAETLSLVGDMAFKAQQINIAIDFMRRAIETAPGEIIYYLSLARIYLAVNDFKNATQVYEELIARNFEYFQSQGMTYNDITNNNILDDNPDNCIKILYEMDAIIHICSKKFERHQYSSEINSEFNKFVEYYVYLNKVKFLQESNDIQLLAEKLSDSIVEIIDLINDNTLDNIVDLFHNKLQILFSEWKKQVVQKIETKAYI